MTKQSHCIAGSITAGCFSTILGHPLDTIKVHQQTNHHLSKSSLIGITKSLAQGNALRLFRGMHAPMANQIIMNSVMFTAFNNVKDVANKSSMLDDNSSAIIAGLFSGFATAFISTPMDWIKIQAQISLANQKNKTYSSGYNTLPILKRQMFRNGKMDVLSFTRTLYSGHVANLAREGVFTMVYLGLYDRITSTVKESRTRENTSHEHESYDQPLGLGEIVFISSFTGACAWLCNYPFDTIKTVMQAGLASSAHEPITMKHAMQKIYKSEGLAAFWRGAGSSTFRAMIVTSSRMLAYETTLQMLK